MPYAALKKILSRLSGKKKPGYASFAQDLRFRGASAEGSRLKNLKNKLTKVWQRLGRKKREHHEEYSRSAGRRRIPLRLVGGFLLVFAVVLLWIYGGGAMVRQGLQSIDVFRVVKVDISGCVAVSREKILDASGIVLHQSNLLGLDIAQIEERLAAVPWVAKAEVKRNWPAQLHISIVENAPIALLHSPGVEGTQLQYLDNEGRAFSAVSPGADVDFPVVTGLVEITDGQLRDRAMDEILTFLAKVRGNDPHLPAQAVSELHVTREGDLIVYLVEYPFPIFLGNGNTKQKYSRLIQVFRALYKKQNSKDLLSEIKYIQMDYLNDKVLVVESTSGQKTDG